MPRRGFPSPGGAGARSRRRLAARCPQPVARRAARCGGWRDAKAADGVPAIQGEMPETRRLGHAQCADAQPPRPSRTCIFPPQAFGVAPEATRVILQTARMEAPCKMVARVALQGKIEDKAYAHVILPSEGSAVSATEGHAAPRIASRSCSTHYCLSAVFLRRSRATR